MMMEKCKPMKKKKKLQHLQPISKDLTFTNYSNMLIYSNKHIFNLQPCISFIIFNLIGYIP
jgi:hypothetical protein